MTALSLDSLRSARPLDSRGRVEILLLAALTAAAAFGFDRVFGDLAATARIMGAGVFALLLVTLFETRNAKLWLSAPILAMGMLLYTAYTQLPATMPFGIPRPATASGLWDGLWSGWADGLDILLPLESTGTTSVLLTYFAWIAGAACGYLLLRWRHVVWPLVPPLVLYGVTLPLAAPAPASALWLPFLLAALALGFLAFRANQRSATDVSVHTAGSVGNVLSQDFQQRTSARAIARSSLPLVLVCAALGVAASLVVAFGSNDPADPRELRPDNVAPEAIINPLTEFKAVRNLNPPVGALALDLPGQEDFSAIDRLPVAVLDAYDGAGWESTARYERRRSELDDPSDENSIDLTQTISLEEVRGPWLPAAQRPIRIDLPEVLFDSETGSLVAPDGVEVELYTVVSRIPVAGTSDLRGAELGGVDDRYTTLPAQVSADVLDLATTLASSADTPHGQTIAIVEYLQTELFIDDDAAPGHSLGRLQKFLFEEKRGSAEQFATALAVMLRTQDIPARVVVGYDLAAASDIDGDRALDVTSEHYDVWVEVPFDGFGWQAFDALPSEAAAEPLPEEVTGTTIPAPSERNVSPEPQPSEASPSEAVEQAPEPRQFGAWIFPALLVAFFAAWLLAFILMVLVSKRRKRKRRRMAPTPVGKIEGAWADATDRLLEAGVEMTPDQTFSEIAVLGAEEFGDGAATALRALVPDVAANAYSPGEPDAIAADRAWQHADQFRKDSTEGRTRRQRVSEKLNPKPLVKSG